MNRVPLHWRRSAVKTNDTPTRKENKTMTKFMSAAVLSVALVLPMSLLAQQEAPAQSTAPVVESSAAPLTKGQMKDQKKQQKTQEQTAKENAKAAKEQQKALQHQDKATNAAEKARAGQPATTPATTQPQ